MEATYIPLGGGMDNTTPLTQMNAGRLRVGKNIESKPGGGYRRVLGYSKYDSTVVPGEGAILGVHYYDGKVYAFRNAVGSATAVMHSSTGSGWTSEKTGLAPNGRYRCINYAFSGTQKMYGASGKHVAFQWDGTAWTDLTTGMATDTPTQIAAHKKHLFLSFGNSVQHSSLGDPTAWTPITGAGEMLMDDDVTGFSTMPNGSLGIFTPSSILLLAGTSSSDWVANNMVEYGNNAGAYSDTIQGMGSAVRFVDARGVIDLGASDVSSDFYDAIISHDLDNLSQIDWSDATASTVIRGKGQYRVFFSDATGVLITFTKGGMMLTRLLYAHTVRCCVNAEQTDGSEIILFGSDDGYIYEMEDGRSFGGSNISAYMETAFTDLGHKHNIKRYRRAHFDVGKSGKTSLEISVRFIVDDGGLRSAADANLAYQGDGTPMGAVATLGSTILGGLPLVEGKSDIVGESQYLSFIFQSDTSDEGAWEIDGIAVDYLLGRRRR